MESLLSPLCCFLSFQSLYGGQFTLSTQLINPKFCVSLSHRCSTTVSLETNPLVCSLLKLVTRRYGFLQCREYVYFFHAYLCALICLLLILPSSYPTPVPPLPYPFLLLLAYLLPLMTPLCCLLSGSYALPFSLLFPPYLPLLLSSSSLLCPPYCSLVFYRCSSCFASSLLFLLHNFLKSFSFLLSSICIPFLLLFLSCSTLTEK